MQPLQHDNAKKKREIKLHDNCQCTLSVTIVNTLFSDFSDCHSATPPLMRPLYRFVVIFWAFLLQWHTVCHILQMCISERAMCILELIHSKKTIGFQESLAQESSAQCRSLKLLWNVDLHIAQLREILSVAINLEFVHYNTVNFCSGLWNSM